MRKGYLVFVILTCTLVGLCWAMGRKPAQQNVPLPDEPLQLKLPEERHAVEEDDIGSRKDAPSPEVKPVKLKVTFFDERGIPVDGEREVLLESKYAPSGVNWIKDVQMGYEQKVKLLYEELIKGLNSAEKGKRWSTAIPPTTKVEKVVILDRTDIPGKKKLYVEFSEDLVKNLDDVKLEKIQRQLIWTLMRSGFKDLSGFEFKVNGKPLTYYLRHRLK